MKEKINKFFKISNENILLLVLALFSFSVGIWGNYKQLWLEANAFTVSEISKIFSVGLICSAVIAFIISLLSNKIKIRDVILLSMVLRFVSMSVLLLKPDAFIIKTCILLGIMCEVIFSISYYPLLAQVNKSDATYRKKAVIDYFAKDAGVISCGLLVGIAIGNIVFDYDSCLVVAIISGILSCTILTLYNPKRKRKETTEKPFVSQIKNIFKSKVITWYIIQELFVYISYGIVFDLMMLILTKYIDFSVSFASIFIIVCNLAGSIACSIFNKYSDKISVSLASIIKYGSRTLAYFVAFFSNNIPVFIVTIVIGFVTSRILDDKVSGIFINKVSNENQFLFGNIRYFINSIGEGIGAYLAGAFIAISFKSLFLGAAIFTLIQTLIVIYMDKLMHKSKK